MLVRPIDNLVLKSVVRDKIRAMKLPARLLLAILTLSLASLTPVLPGEPIPPLQQKTSCCADMNMDGGVRCPINPGGTSTATCCTAPAVCLLLYFSGSNDFIPGVHSAGLRDSLNHRVTTRSYRPPVPPPRVSLA
jgi:hypothetical protein